MVPVETKPHISEMVNLMRLGGFDLTAKTFESFESVAMPENFLPAVGFMVVSFDSLIMVGGGI